MWKLTGVRRRPLRWTDGRGGPRTSTGIREPWGPTDIPWVDPADPPHYDTRALRSRCSTNDLATTTTHAAPPLPRPGEDLRGGEPVRDPRRAPGDHLCQTSAVARWGSRFPLSDRPLVLKPLRGEDLSAHKMCKCKYLIVFVH